MPSRGLICLGWFLLLGVAFVQWIVRLEPAPRPARVALSPAGEPLTYRDHVRPLLDQYCFGCHGEKKRAGLDLRPYQSSTAVLGDRPTFESVLKHVRSGLMPPANKPQPTPAEREQLVAWLEGELHFCDCSKPDPGHVTVRRLNRNEYNNTIRDLLDVDLRPADDFPADDTGYGFDNIGDVLSVPPVLFEKYLAAAARVLDQAIVTGPPPPPVHRFAARELAGGSANGSQGRSLASQGEITATRTFAAPGDYTLRLTAFGDQAGPEPVRIAARLGKQELRALEVTATAAAPGRYEIPFHAPAGEHRLAVAFLNDYYQPEAPDPGQRDRNFHLVHLELVGPILTNWPPLPPSHTRIFGTNAVPATAAGRIEAARAILQRFANRAFRRPASPQEIERLLEFHRAAAAEGANFQESVKRALEAVLVSPHFLFRTEPRPAVADRAGRYHVDEFALASRLSYFLWSTMPDAELFALAERHRLRQNLDPQVRRMLRDPKARALVEHFAGQWLQLRKLEEVEPDPTEFPAFNPALRAAMRQETERFVDRIRLEDRSVLEFVEADWTYANAALARHYGLPELRGEDLQLVTLKGTPRGGLLTQASILTLTSNPTRTSPVKRGKWVLDNLLGAPPPPPPPDVPLLNESSQARLTGSLRQRMEQHRADPLCASCHALMDPIGFGFENYDGIGAWRTRDGDFTIDPAGALTSGESFQGPADLKRLLLTSRRDEFLRCLASKMLTYALGRGLEYYDQCAVDEISRALEQNDYRFSALIAAVARSVPFQMQRAADALAAAPH